MFSDHEFLYYIHKMAEHNTRLIHYTLKLATYDLKVHHTY